MIRAAEEYEAASKFFMVAAKVIPALSCMHHAAKILCKLRDYLPAAELFATIGQQELRNNLTKFQARESFFLSGLLLLANGSRGDFPLIKERLEAFSVADDLFRESPHFYFLHNLMMVIDSGDLEQFSFHIYAYSSVHDIDILTLEIFSDIMKQIRA